MWEGEVASRRRVDAEAATNVSSRLRREGAMAKEPVDRVSALSNSTSSHLRQLYNIEAYRNTHSRNNHVSSARSHDLN